MNSSNSHDFFDGNEYNDKTISDDDLDSGDTYTDLEYEHNDNATISEEG